MNPPETDHQPSAPSIVRALVLVLAMLLYNYASDRVWDWLGVSDVSWDSPWKVPLLACGWLFSIVGVVWGGIVVWGRTSLRELGWTFVPAGRLAVAGLLLATVMIGLVVAVYRVFGGPTGIDDLLHTLASYSPGRRIFFAVMGVKIAFVEESVFRGDLVRSLRTPIVSE